VLRRFQKLIPIFFHGMDQIAELQEDIALTTGLRSDVILSDKDYLRLRCGYSLVLSLFVFSIILSFSMRLVKFFSLWIRNCLLNLSLVLAAILSFSPLIIALFFALLLFSSLRPCSISSSISWTLPIYLYAL